MSIDPNAPIYPTDGEHLVDLNTGHEQVVGRFPGLTIRAHFAAMAMQGLMANSHGLSVMADRDRTSEPRSFWHHYAEDAVIAADVLIAELNKGDAK